VFAIKDQNGRDTTEHSRIQSLKLLSLSLVQKDGVLVAFLWNHSVLCKICIFMLYWMER